MRMKKARPLTNMITRILIRTEIGDEREKVVYRVSQVIDDKRYLPKYLYGNIIQYILN
jgi:hypothetical protein